MSEIGELKTRGAALSDDEQFDRITAVHQERNSERVVPRVSGRKVQRHVDGLSGLQYRRLAGHPEAAIGLV